MILGFKNKTDRKQKILFSVELTVGEETVENEVAWADRSGFALRR
jgi:hypothetical protein